MPFLNPLLLWFGVASVSIPIAIHLLNKRKFDRVVWAAMRFLRVSVEQNQRRIQFEDILLLILRCLILLLLGLALARPAWHAAQAAGLFGQSRVVGVVVLDNSYSMSATDGAQSRFDQAKDAAQKVLNTLPSGSSVAVLLASDAVHKSDWAIPEPTSDLNLVRKVIAEAKLCDRASNLVGPLREAVDAIKNRSASRKELFVISDGQALGYRQFNDIRQLLDDASKSEQNVRGHFLLVGTPLAANLGVSALKLADDLPTLGRSLRFEVSVTNYGTDEARDIPVKLHTDDNTHQPTGEATIDVLPPGATKAVILHATFYPPAEGQHDAGYHTVTASLPTDHLPADDARTLAVHVRERVHVLLVDGDPGARPEQSETFNLRNILQPVPLALQDKHYLQVTTVGPNELRQDDGPSAGTGTAERTRDIRLDDYDAIFVANVADFSNATLEDFAAYLRRGRGGIVFCPGPNTSAKFYNEQLADKFHFLPAKLGEAVGRADQEAVYFTLQDKAFEHPIAEIWSDPAAGKPSSGHFYRAFPLMPVADAGASTQPTQPSATSAPAPATNPADKFAAEAGVPRVVLRYAKGTSDGTLAGQPAVMERTWGLGRVVLFSSTISRKWNDMVYKPAIFPLVYRTLDSIVGRQDEALNVKAGEKFVYRVADDYLNKDAFVFRGDQQYTLDSRKVELVRGIPTVTDDQTDVAGPYRVALGTADKASADPNTVITFAVQGDPAESVLEEITPAQKESLKQVADVIEWKNGGLSEAKIEKARLGTEWWLPIAALVAALATAETFLAAWFSRAK